jgi:hypothetical protein
VFDLIGDIHGYAQELRQLLEKLGYCRKGGIYSHPERRVIFLGDFIDRGPHIREVLEIVRPMVESGSALAVMGNHELNALAYHTPDGRGGHFRKHESKNVRQHSETLQQLSESEMADALEWFRTLPLWLDLPGLGAVHACWDDAAIADVQKGLQVHGGITTDFLRSATVKGGALFEPVEVLLKGKEMPLPDGMTYRDKEGHVRTEARTRWYLSPAGHTVNSYTWKNDGFETDAELNESIHKSAMPYPADAKPVFVGHYWLTGDVPELLAPNVACLDYSVAKQGMLVAYRWDGEQTLSNEKFVWVKGGNT